MKLAPVAGLPAVVRSVLLSRHSLIDEIEAVVAKSALISAARKYTGEQAAQSSKRKVPIKSVVVSLQGEILSEDWA